MHGVILEASFALFQSERSQRLVVLLRGEQNLSIRGRFGVNEVVVGVVVIVVAIVAITIHLPRSLPSDGVFVDDVGDFSREPRLAPTIPALSAGKPR